MKYRLLKTSNHIRWSRLSKNSRATKRRGTGKTRAVDGEAGNSHSPNAIHQVVSRIASQHEALQQHLDWWSGIEKGLVEADTENHPQEE
jgi:hypothetical protein